MVFETMQSCDLSDFSVSVTNWSKAWLSTKLKPEKKSSFFGIPKITIINHVKIGRVKIYINGCIFKIHPLRYTVKYTSTGVFSKIGKFWNYTLWSIKRQNCLCTATGVFSKMKCLILFQKFYESICIWMSNTWIRNTWLLE